MTSMKHPQWGLRIPAETKKKARLKATMKDLLPGEYITQLIEEDCKDINLTEQNNDTLENETV